MSAGFTSERIEDFKAFAALAPEWWDLWRRATSATPFQSPAWLLPWWRHFHPGTLFVVTVRHGDRLVGLAPFYLEDGALGRRLLPVGISLSDYLDVLVDPDHREVAGQALVDHVAGEGGWDEWDFEELAPGAAALDLPVPPLCEEQLAGQSPCPVLVFQDGHTGFQDAVPARQKRNLRLALNRAARRGDLAIHQADRETAPVILDLLFRLHGARWESRGEAGVLADDTVQNFQREAVPGLLRAGLLRLYLLRFGNHPAAAYYGFLHGHRAYSYLTGFSPDFPYESPGTILLAHAIEQALAEGARELHFLRGPEVYKYSWGAMDRWNMRRSLRRLGPPRAHA